MPSLLVTGAKGQLGRCFNSVKKEFPNHQLIFADQSEVDLTHPETLHKFYDIHLFEGIINCAAYTKVDKANKEIDKAININAKGVANLSDFAQRNKLFLVLIYFFE